ncbi:uncharacterized protein LOC120321435 [Drosophila yakuba]|uniref:uncharacterized protein LOC120321435 n=1 Tax=Drosophila yakuba TaxID=7245 RepID=UPI00193080F4|nr:uncharacterized protein LOC120321435 [Drosophila yakuba]
MRLRSAAGAEKRDSWENLGVWLLLSECKTQLSIIVGHLSCNPPHCHLGQQITDEYTDGKPANGALNGLGQLKIQLKLSECSVIIIMDIMVIMGIMGIMELGILMVLVSFLRVFRG